MIRTRLSLVVALTVCASPSLKPREPKPLQSRHTSFILTSQIQGTLAPCGCSESMRGGIAKVAQYLEDAKTNDGDVVYLDAGETLFSTEKLNSEAAEGEMRKASTLASALQAMGLRAKGTSPLDNAAGEAFRQSLKLAELPSRSDAKVTASKLFNEKGHVFAVIQSASADHLALDAKAARAEGAQLVVAFFEGSFEALLSQVPDDGTIDLAVATRAEHALSLESNRLQGQRTKKLQLQSRLRSIARLDIDWGPEAGLRWSAEGAEREREQKALEERIELLEAELNAPGLNAALKALKQQKLLELQQRRAALQRPVVQGSTTLSQASLRLVPVEAHLPQSAVVKALVAKYDREVGALNLKAAIEHGHDCPPVDAQGRGVVGTARCQGCHPQAFETWKNTKHSQAFATLEKEGKALHLECVSCHVTGWQQPGGVCRLNAMAERHDVGCESCHGPGSLHVARPTKQTIQRGVGAETCSQCHNAEHAPHFDYQTYLPHILGLGHQLKAQN